MSLGQDFVTQATVAFDLLVDDLRNADMGPLLDQYLTDLEELHHGYFQSETDPAGKAWAPLKKATILRKGHDEILIDEGWLLDSLRGRTQDAIRSQNMSGDEWRLEYGTSVKYAKFHQYGVKERNLPQRSMVGVSDAVVDAWTEEFAAVILDQV